jgi:DNA-binding NarL/FixJ family response regulator
METQTAKFSFLIGFHNRLCAEGLRSMINENEVYNVFDLMQNGVNLIQSVKSKKVDLLILDLIYPGCDSIEYLKEIKKTNKALKVLIISDLTRNGMLTDILNTGIEGYILHSCGKNDLHNAIQKLLNNERYICTSITSQFLCKIGENSKYPDNINLTEREKEILSLLIKTKSNKLIASELNISELTVKTHRKNIMRKFGSRNLLSLVRYACRENLINGKDDDFCKGCPHRYRLTYN